MTKVLTAKLRDSAGYTEEMKIVDNGKTIATTVEIKKEHTRLVFEYRRGIQNGWRNGEQIVKNRKIQDPEIANQKVPNVNSIQSEKAAELIHAFISDTQQFFKHRIKTVPSNSEPLSFDRTTTAEGSTTGTTVTRQGMFSLIESELSEALVATHRGRKAVEVSIARQ